MKPLKNAYADMPGFYCFACSRENPLSLKMEFYHDGDEIIAPWRPLKEHQGYLDVLHGGIQSTLMDEIASWAIFVLKKTAGFTSRMTIRFKHPVSIHQEVTLRAKIQETRRNLVTVKTTLEDESGRICTEAEVTYYTFSPEEAEKRMGFPGAEAFEMNISRNP